MSNPESSQNKKEPRIFASLSQLNLGTSHSSLKPFSLGCNFQYFTVGFLEPMYTVYEYPWGRPHAKKRQDYRNVFTYLKFGRIVSNRRSHPGYIRKCVLARTHKLELAMKAFVVNAWPKLIKLQYSSFVCIRLCSASVRGL